MCVCSYLSEHPSPAPLLYVRAPRILPLIHGEFPESASAAILHLSTAVAAAQPRRACGPLVCGPSVSVSAYRCPSSQPALSSVPRRRPCCSQASRPESSRRVSLCHFSPDKGTHHHAFSHILPFLVPLPALACSSSSAIPTPPSLFLFPSVHSVPSLPSPCYLGYRTSIPLSPHDPRPVRKFASIHPPSFKLLAGAALLPSSSHLIIQISFSGISALNFSDVPRPRV